MKNKMYALPDNLIEVPPVSLQSFMLKYGDKYGGRLESPTAKKKVLTKKNICIQMQLNFLNTKILHHNCTVIKSNIVFDNTFNVLNIHRDYYSKKNMLLLLLLINECEIQGGE